MANYFASQSGAGSNTGADPDNAWAVASIPWTATVDNDPDNVLYLLGAISSRVLVGSTTGHTIRGDWPGQECTIDVADAADACIYIQGKTFTAAAPLIVKNISVQGSDDSVTALGDVYIGASHYVVIENVICDGTSTDENGIQVGNSSNILIKDCVIRNYTNTGTEGINMNATGASTLENCVITGCKVENANTGIQINNFSGTLRDIYVTNNRIHACLATGLAGYTGAGYTSTGFYYEGNYVSSCGGTSGGTNISVSGAATADVSKVFLRNNVSIDAQGVGNGIRLDDNVYDSVISGNLSMNQPKGFIVKEEGNKVHNNIALNCSTSGIEYQAPGGGTSLGVSIYNNLTKGCASGFLQTSGSADNSQIHNNIFLDCSVQGMRINDNSTRVESHNCFYNCTYNFRDASDNAETLDSTDIVDDPRLNDDLTLQATSPCIGAGYPALSEKDFDGKRRRFPLSDIGPKWFDALEDSTRSTLLASGGT